MIGSFIRRKQERWVRKYFFMIVRKPQFSGVFSEYQLEKIVKFAVGFNQAVMSVAFFFAIMTVFMKYVLPRLEFEKTVVLILVIFMFLLRSLTEKLGRDEK